MKKTTLLAIFPFIIVITIIIIFLLIKAPSCNRYSHNESLQKMVDIESKKDTENNIYNDDSIKNANYSSTTISIVKTKKGSYIYTGYNKYYHLPIKYNRPISFPDTHLATATSSLPYEIIDKKDLITFVYDSSDIIGFNYGPLGEAYSSDGKTIVLTVFNKSNLLFNQGSNSKELGMAYNTGIFMYDVENDKLSLLEVLSNEDKDRKLLVPFAISKNKNYIVFYKKTCTSGGCEYGVADAIMYSIKDRRFKNVERVVSFEWLADENYRYKSFVKKDNCQIVMSEFECMVEMNKIPWKYGKF